MDEWHIKRSDELKVVILLFIITKILLLCLLYLPLQPSNILTVGITSACSKGDEVVVDVSWVVITTMALVLIQFYLRPQRRRPCELHHSIGYVCFCMVSTTFYLFVNINEITPKCSAEKERYTLIILTTILELIVMFLVVSGRFRDQVKSMDIIV